MLQQKRYASRIPPDNINSMKGPKVCLFLLEWVDPHLWVGWGPLGTGDPPGDPPNNPVLCQVGLYK